MRPGTRSLGYSIVTVCEGRVDSVTVHIAFQLLASPMFNRPDAALSFS